MHGKKQSVSFWAGWEKKSAGRDTTLSGQRWSTGWVRTEKHMRIFKTNIFDKMFDKMTLLTIKKKSYYKV